MPKMSSFMPTKWLKRGGLPVLAEKEAKDLIYKGTFNKALICQILDIDPDLYETRLAGYTRQLMRGQHYKIWPTSCRSP